MAIQQKELQEIKFKIVDFLRAKWKPAQFEELCDCIKEYRKEPMEAIAALTEECRIKYETALSLTGNGRFWSLVEKPPTGCHD